MKKLMLVYHFLGTTPAGWRRSSVFIVNFEYISHLFSSVSIVNFEQLNAGWDLIKCHNYQG